MSAADRPDGGQIQSSCLEWGQGDPPVSDLRLHDGLWASDRAAPIGARRS